MIWQETGIKKLDELMDGGIPLKALTELYGPPQAGKTIFAIQQACIYMKMQGRSVLWIATEGGFQDHIFPYWSKQFSERFDVKFDTGTLKLRIREKRSEPRKKDKMSEVKDVTISYDVVPSNVKSPSFITTYLPNITQVLAFLGKPIKIQFSEGGKADIIPLPQWQLTFSDPELSTLGEVCNKYNIGMVVIDSVTATIGERAFPSKAEQFPARFNALRLMLGVFEDLTERIGITTIGIAHETGVNPINPFAGSIGKLPKGGYAERYTFKYSIYLRFAARKDAAFDKNDPVRRMRMFVIARHPYKPNWDDGALCQMTDSGFVDLSADMKPVEVSSDHIRESAEGYGDAASDFGGDSAALLGSGGAVGDILGGDEQNPAGAGIKNSSGGLTKKLTNLPSKKRKPPTRKQ